MEWKQNGSYTSIEETVIAKSGLTKDELLNPKNNPADNIVNLPQAKNMIQSAITKKLPITVVGDYDADGITASVILSLLFQALGAEVKVRLPKRFSEGYGLSQKIIDECKPGLLLTVDNGIAAVDVIAEAKKKGFQTIVLDHHIPGELLPDADIIVDPHIAPDKNGYADYCGAGLAYKLAQLMLSDKNILNKMSTLAAIGTVADSVPLTGDNRVIVKQGLRNLQRKIVPEGIKRSFTGCRNLPSNRK